MVLRVLALLALDRGESAPTVSALVRFSPQPVRNIAQGYRAEGLDGALYEWPRPGAAEVLAPAEKQRIIAMVCADPPAEAARWTVRLITEQAVKRKIVDQVGRETIRVLLQSHDLKPWREKMWCLATLDAECLAPMEDVLALYERPLNPVEPVVCFDEKPVSLHADVRAPRPARPAHVANRDHEYRRCRIANIFGVVEPKAGRHFTGATPNRSGADCARMVRRMITAYPDARTIHLVLDNLNTHRSRRCSITTARSRAHGSGLG
ncbi:MAG: IS630 family transposase [Gemmatimonas sp.]